MLLDAAITETRSKGEKTRRELKERAGRRYPSYILLERLRTTKRSLSIEFGTSVFAIAETTRVIFDEYLARRMYDLGIPYQYWESVRRNERLSEDDLMELRDQINRFLSAFFSLHGSVLNHYEEYSFQIVSALITSVRVSTTDAILVATAMQSGCAYFVTEDHPLRQLLRSPRLDKSPFLNRIDGISSQTILSKIEQW